MTRFIKGQSGNPKGRPKGSKNLMTLIEQELDRTISVTEDGQRKTISKRLALAKQLVNKAVAQDWKAIALLASLIRPNDADTAPNGESRPSDAAKDQEVLLSWLTRMNEDEPQSGIDSDEA
jgi:hypothetical protein